MLKIKIKAILIEIISLTDVAPGSHLKFMAPMLSILIESRPVALPGLMNVLQSIFILPMRFE